MDWPLEYSFNILNWVWSIHGTLINLNYTSAFVKLKFHLSVDQL